MKSGASAPQQLITKPKERIMETIAKTPTWEEMVPSVVEIIRNPDNNPEVIRHMTEYLKRMARLADAYAKNGASAPID